MDAELEMLAVDDNVQTEDIITLPMHQPVDEILHPLLEIRHAKSLELKSLELISRAADTVDVRRRSWPLTTDYEPCLAFFHSSQGKQCI